jgi:xanthine dehydrogenase YagR molybdenum-binding subunit
VASWPTNPELIGKSTRRIDGPDKTQGKAKYTYDLTRPNMLYGRFVRSPHAHARVVSIDLTEAQKAPGVKAALAVIDLSNPDQLTHRVRYQGQEVAAVAAETEAQARDAARLVRVQYEVLPHLATVEQAMRPEAPKVFPDGNVRQANVQEEGDAEAALKTSAQVVEYTYSTQVQTHMSLETHGCISEWDGDKLTIWSSTQGVHSVREGVAKALNIPQANIRVITEYMGGGFGSKLSVDRIETTSAQLAKQAGRPVKLMLDRREEQLVTGNRPSAHARIRAGASAEGRVTVFDAESWGTGGAGAGAGFPLPYIYNFPVRRRRHSDVYINAGPQRAMRAPGHPQGCFITEALMDDLAAAVKMDPLEFRLKNLPPEAPDAMWGARFKTGAEKFGWSKRHPDGDPTPGPIKRGMGCASNRWAGGGSRQTRGQCEIFPDGGVVMRIGTQDIGTGTRTVVEIVTAETFGLTLDQVVAEIGDTRYPWAPGSGGSVSVGSVAPMARVCAEQALAKLAEKVAPALGVAPADIVASKGHLASKTDAAKKMTWKDACKLLGTTSLVVDAPWETGLSSVGTSGVQFADVEVDIETGITKVKRIVCVQDCGLIVNRLTAESQCNGGITMGIGFALFEHRILDRNTAQMVNPNMEFYLMPGPSDMPEIDVTLVDMPERGIVGLGEPPTISTAAAIANAVSNAIGVRIRSLPITPENVLAALAGRKAGGSL